MLFHMHNKKVNTLTPKIINTIIEKVEELKMLGLTQTQTQTQKYLFDIVMSLAWEPPRKIPKNI